MRLSLVISLALILMGCTTVTGDMDPPKVTVENVEASPTDGTPRFLITLNIVNPNKQALDIAGVSYSIDIMGKELVTGVTNQVPKIEPYSEQQVELEAGVRLFELVRLLAGLGMEPTDELEDQFEAKIDFHGWMPTQRVDETGVISLR